MRRFGWQWFAISSLLLTMSWARAETRPAYGGTLRIAMRATPASLDPADAQPDSFARRTLTRLIFDTLVSNDQEGRIQPALATTWQAQPGYTRWQFSLRSGVKFHDGTPLTVEAAAESLRAANPAWKVSADGQSLVIELDAADRELPAELALSRNAITKKGADNKPIGTGPFHAADWQPGKKLTLAAEESHWRGRPFLDAIEIEMGKSYRDQMMALELGRADIVEVAAEQAHKLALDPRRLVSSPPVELLALVFARDAQSPDEKLLPEALALSVERSSIRNVLLQGGGQPAGGILPNWISGYEFVFPTEADLPRARHDREQVRNDPAWTLGYDNNDALARVLAERIALNAKDAGLSLRPVSSGTTDVRLVRIPLASADPWVDLANVTTALGMPMKSRSGSVEDLYAAEQAVLAAERIIPLVHLPVSYAAATAVKNWNLQFDGSLDLANAWLASGKP